MPKPKVFLTRIIPEKGLKLVTEFCQAEVWEADLPPSHAEILKRVRGVNGLLCLLTDRIDGEIMEAAGPDLRVISNHAVGFDNIDLQEATRRGIPVGNTPGILTESTADFAFALLMAAARKVVEGDRFVRLGKWKTWGPSLLLGVDIHEATLGIVGFGRIGKALAKRASGFNMRVIFYDPHHSPDTMFGDPSAQPVGFETLLRESDFISIHTPLNVETRYMFDQEAFAKMKPSAILVNTARGAVVDPSALYEALKSGRIAYAALDVTEPEPIPENSPLLELENLIITPHIASASRVTREKMATMAAENLLAGVNSEPLPYCVNPEVYEAV
jgi:glyoxylate reductase